MPDITKELQLFNRIRADIGCINYKFGMESNMFTEHFGGFMRKYRLLWDDVFGAGYYESFLDGKSLEEKDVTLEGILSSMMLMNSLKLGYDDFDTEKAITTVMMCRASNAKERVKTKSIHTLVDYKKCFAMIQEVDYKHETAPLLQETLKNVEGLKVDVSVVEFVKDMASRYASDVEVAVFIYSNCHMYLKQLMGKFGWAYGKSVTADLHVCRAVYDMCESHRWMADTKKWRDIYRSIRDQSEVLYRKYIEYSGWTLEAPTPEHVPELLRELFASITAAATRDYESGIDIFCDDIPYFARPSRAIPRQVPTEEKDAE
jgi:uncharacterized membrane-anchored protein YjiN (DUF445 family)